MRRERSALLPSNRDVSTHLILIQNRIHRLLQARVEPRNLRADNGERSLSVELPEAASGAGRAFEEGDEVVRVADGEEDDVCS